MHYVTALRRIVYRHRWLAALLVAVSLALKVLVPAGFMPVVAKNGTITVQICSGTAMGPMTMETAIPGLPPKHDDRAPASKAEMPCAFAGLAMPMLAGTDAQLLALALAFVMALAIYFVAIPPLRHETHLRPPLRGPPTTA